MLPQEHYNDSSEITRIKMPPAGVLAGAGTLLVIIHAAIALVSPGFSYDIPLAERPVMLFVALELMASGVFLASILIVRRITPSRSLLAYMLVMGALMRAIMMLSTPILENDFNRYLLDGAVLAHAGDPYGYAPVDFQDGSDKRPNASIPLTRDAKEVIENINYPHLRTIYPPVAQAVFATAHFIKPWSLAAWRFTLLFFDVITLILLAVALKRLGLSAAWLAVYWWNPLVLTEIINSAHMDVIILPLVLGALLLSAARQHTASFIALALGTGAKLWPVLLPPILLWPLRRRLGRAILCLGLYGGICAAFFVPIYLGGLDEGSGFTAYGRMWEMNDALYMLFHWIVGLFTFTFGHGIGNLHSITRIIVGVLLLSWIAWVMRRGFADESAMWEKALLITAGLFMLSPTQFPWYYVWVIPFLTLRPRVSLLVMNALLPLYYVRFYCKAHGDVHVFDNYLVWLEYVPVFLLIIWEWIGYRKGRTPYLSVSRFKTA